MNAAEHRREAEQALAASVEHRRQWSHHEPGTAAADASYDAAMWEMRRAEVHALLALSSPPSGPRPAGTPTPPPGKPFATAREAAQW